MLDIEKPRRISLFIFQSNR